MPASFASTEDFLHERGKDGGKSQTLHKVHHKNSIFPG